MKTAADLAATIDHTLLRPEATPDQIDALCAQAVRYGFAGVCVNPAYVQRAANNLQIAGRSPSTAARCAPRPVVISVAGFPLGVNLTVTKEEEARRGLDDGATEIDMVLHLGALVAGDYRSVRAEIERLACVVHREGSGRILKVILETAALTPDQIVAGCRCCAEGEADFVKTSTGFHPSGGATIEHVRLLYRHASPMRVKASGGIRTAAQAIAMLEAGAARIGTSAGAAMMQELEADRG
jgi:deoxyribose-phosphate aldolase